MASLRPKQEKEEAAPKGHARTQAVALDVFGGLLAALVSVAYCVSYAALICSGKLAKFLPFGISAALVSAAVIGLVVSARSSLNFMIAGPDSNAAAILALMAGMAGTSLHALRPDISPWSTVFVILMVSSTLIGLVLYALGRFRLGRLIRFIPYPVVGGFLAGTGWLITLGAFSVMMGYPFGWDSFVRLFELRSTLHWLPGLVFAVLLLLAVRKYRHFLVMPCLLVGFVFLFHAVLLWQGISLKDAVARGLLFTPFENGQLMKAWGSVSLADVEWSMILEQISEMMALMAVVVITILLNATGVEIATMKDVDLDRELRITGGANVLAGLFGGMIGYVSISRSLLNFKAGATSRLAGLVAAGICASLLFWGSHLLVYLPKAILGGLLLYLGLSLLVEWVIDAFTKVSRFEYAIILVILFIIAAWDFLAGVGLGVIVACLVFAYNYSRIQVVKYALTGSERQSNVERSLHLQQLLEERGAQIYILSLQGYIFFGTATTVLDRVKRKLEMEIDLPEEERIKFLVLDFRLVSEVDSSAILSFVKMRQVAERHDVVLIFTQMKPKIEEGLRNNGCLVEGDTVARAFTDLDRSVEWCENQIIEREADGRKEAPSLEELLSQQFRDKSLVPHIFDFLQPVELASGRFLFHRGDPPDGLYFLEKGKISVVFELPEGGRKRLRSIREGTVVGEMGLYLEQGRSAAVFIERPSRLYLLTKEEMARMLEEQPLLASEVHRFIVTLLARRLDHTNRQLRALS